MRFFASALIFRFLTGAADFFAGMMGAGFAAFLTAAHRLRCVSAMAFLALADSLRLLRVFLALVSVPLRRARAASSLRISASMPAIIEVVSMRIPRSEFYLFNTTFRVDFSFRKGQTWGVFR